MSILFDAPWVPTTSKFIRKMLRFANLKPGEILYDLGCGDGRILLIAAREFNARAIGIEINPLLVGIANFRVFIRQLQDQAQVRWGDIFNQDISNANIIIMYLLQITNNKMQDKLKKELEPGTRVLSYVFNFPEWQPIKVDEDNKLYLYEL